MFLKRKAVVVNMFWSFIPLFTYSTNYSLSALAPGLYMEEQKGKRSRPQPCHCLTGQTDKQKFNCDSVLVQHRGFVLYLSSLRYLSYVYIQ